MIKNCGRCERAVYPTEELKCLDKVWHKTCFKCQTCGMTLNMKTYKGFNKLPYCEAHIPKVKATTVSETPESRRLAENTKLQSQVKYHEDFEKAKGKFTQVADDPETLRIKANTKIISNVAYHGELEKKALMEQKRNLTGADDTVKSESPEPLSISPLPPSVHQATQQQQKVHIDPNANQYTPGKIINNQQKLSVGNVPPDQNESPYSARQYSSSTTVYSSQPNNEDLVEYLWEDVGTGKSRAQPTAFFHGVAAPPSRAVGSIADYDPLNENYGSIARSYRGPSQNQQPQSQYVANQQVPSHQHQIRNQAPPQLTTICCCEYPNQVKVGIIPHEIQDILQSEILLLSEVKSHPKMHKSPPRRVHFDTISSRIRSVTEYARPLFVGAPFSQIAPLQRVRNLAVRAGISCNSDAKPLQLIQYHFDVLSISVFNKYFPCPPSEEVSKLVPERIEPLRSNHQSTAQLDYLLQVKSESPEPLSISPLPPSVHQATQQQQKVHIDPNANQYTPGKIINNQQKLSVGNVPPDQNESPYSARQYSSSTTVYSSQPNNEDLVEYLWEDVGTGKSRAQPTAFFHGVAAPPSRAVGSIADYDPLNENYGSIARSYRGPSQNQQPQSQYVANQQVPSHQHQIRNQGYSQSQSVQQPQQQQYPTPNNVSGYRQQNYMQQSTNQYQQPPAQYQPPQQVSQQYSGQRQSQVKSNQPTGYQSQGQYQSPAYQANPTPPQYQTNPAAQYQQSQPQYQNNYRQETYLQQQQYQPYNQGSMQRKPQGQAFRAMYDYDAQDTDEVSFLDGDIIINCTPIDEGWMTGTVKRTGQNGMIPANYVEQIH
ncbi:LIM and SH3 domain protein Lasp-like [Artemia franciscana]|uniref:LIM and SH3 domain protein Lasp-like n=1 Tax=Artemia franciscana TaxID=6661 RepID=UPI0032DAAF60